MAMTKLGNKELGSTVKIKVNGVEKEWLVVHQGIPSSAYDASCDGTWLLMKDIYEKREWNSGGENDYANSDCKRYLNSTFVNLIDSNISNHIKWVRIPYVSGVTTSVNYNLNTGANGLSTRIFPLSITEAGLFYSYAPSGEGAALEYFRIGNTRVANLDGRATGWWTRSPCTNPSSGRGHVMYVNNNGGTSYNASNVKTYGFRPAMILPANMMVSDDGTVSANTAPTTPSSLSVPNQINGGSTITVSWGAATDAENNLEGYVVERSTNGGGSWTQVYQGGGTSTTNTVPAGTETVMYRVKAYDSEGLYSGYRTSNQITVINNNAPGVPASITIPNEVIGGQSLIITWGAAMDVDGDLAGYSLERQIDNGAWTEVYKGGNLSYADAVTRGWASVCYRVRAYDSHGAYGGYATSQSRQVNNNIAPVITCTQFSGADLGAKDGGFTIAYSVEDPDGDTVTVTEAVDGVEKRTFKPEPGVSNSFAVTGEYFMRLLNGTHTMTITATDGKGNTVHTLTFTKEVHKATITLAEPLDADAKIEICVLSVIGRLPVDAKFTVEVTNNAKDNNPVWEDCTEETQAGANHVFKNTIAVNGFAFNFMIRAERGPSGEGGYISSAQGGFQ